MIDYSEGLMSNNGGGTYTYNLVVEKPGIISILIYSRQSNYIEATLYSDEWLSGTSRSEIWSTIDSRSITTFKSATYVSNWKGPT